jgi:hypothetical protein
MWETAGMILLGLLAIAALLLFFEYYNASNTPVGIDPLWN